jgi:4-hydroxybenzoate polyprenyltransferase
MGVISPRVAWVIGVALGASATLLARPLGLWVTILTAIGLVGGFLYDGGLKYTAFSWLPFVIAFPTLPLWAWAGVHPEEQLPARLWWVVPVAGVLVVGIHLADTIPDLVRDTEAGVRGLAHRLGLRRSLALCWGEFAGALLLTLGLWGVIPYLEEWYLPGLAASAFLMFMGVLTYLRDPAKVKTMSLLLEMGAIVLAVGWLGAIML